MQCTGHGARASRCCPQFVPAMVRALHTHNVKVLCDAASLTARRAGIDSDLLASAGEEDFGHEFLSLALSVKVVDSLDEASRTSPDMAPPLTAF